MTNELDKTFKFRIPSDQLSKLMEACRKNDETAAQIIRRAIRDYIKKSESTEGKTNND